VSCFSRDAARRESFADEFELERSAESYEALLADPAVEAVIVSTPNDLHVGMALAAVAAGKPVLIDKPISVDIPGGLAVLRAAAGGAHVGVAHHARRLAGHRTAQRWLASGDGGNPRLVHADFSNARGALMKPDAWHRRVAGAEAGVLIQVGIHPVDTVLSLFGPPVAVNARLGYETMGPLADAAVVLITHASGVVSTVTSSWTTPSLYRVEIQAGGGNLRYRLDHGHWSSGDVDDHGTLTLDRDGEPEIVLEMGKGDPLAEQLEELAAAARGTGTMEVDAAAGLRAMAVVVAAVRSTAARGAEVAIGDLLAAEGATVEEVALLTEAPKEVS
jgi:predicted dehydrogenase